MTRSTADGPSMPAVTEPGRRRGRPRSAEIDHRILEAAWAVYAERGWAGFNFDVVATQASVSKDAIYRRYRTRIELLLAAMSSGRRRSEVSIDQDIRRYLFGLAKEHFDRYVAEHGFGVLRIFVEASESPELLDAYHHERSAPDVLAARARVRAAIESDELPTVSSPTVVLDAVLGGVVMHVMATPPELRSQMIAGAEQFLSELVDLVLQGAGYQRTHK